LLRDRLTIYRAQLSRSGGGRLELWGDLFFDRRMDLRASVRACPLEAIPGLAGRRLGVGGELSGSVHGTGSLADPRLEGRLALSKAKLRGMDLGSGELSFTPAPDDVRVRGHLLGNTIRLDGVLHARPRPTARLTVDVTRFPLEKMVRELRLLGDVRSAVDGRVQLHADTSAGLSWGVARLSRAEVSLLYTPWGERRVRRIELAAAGGITANYDGKTLRVEPARLVSRIEGQSQNRADFTVGGTVSPEGPDLRLRGRVAMALAEFFLAHRLKQAQGYANADVHLAGRFGDLSLGGRADLGDVRLRVAGYGREIRIRGGSLRFDPGEIQLSSVQIELESALLAASGGLSLKQFRPDRANLRLSGDLNMRLLQIFFPRRFSHAGGVAAIALSVNGPVGDPQLTGKLKIRHIELSPRGLGRTIALSSGEVHFSNYLVKTARPLEGTYDEGNLRVSGEVRLDRWEPVDIYLKIVGVGIPQRQPNVYTAEANLDLTLLGDSGQLTLKGDVDLVDARYVRPFDVVKQAFIRPRVFEEETPFWKGTPLLENLQLRLNVQSTGQLSVKNDYASLSLSGALAISGTLAAPRLGGQIRVEEGNFRIPFLRGDYTISRGEVSFNERKSADSAEINISGETIFPDRNGVEYQIRLTLQGPLNGIKIQLSSMPSLDQGQILALLATGRTTDQLRKQLRSTTEGSGQAAGVADAQVKQLTGEILSNIIEEPLKRVTRLDVARLEVGTESAQIRVCKKLGRYANLCGDYEYGMLGDTRAEGRMEIKISDLLMLVGKLERFTTRLEVETVDPQRGRGELKLRFPIR
jgi:autotransporter translocation and assembly factor TamB